MLQMKDNLKYITEQTSHSYDWLMLVSQHGSMKGHPIRLPCYVLQLYYTIFPRFPFPAIRDAKYRE